MYFHENESNSYPPMEIYEHLFANDFDASSLYDSPSGFFFERGPNIYATEFGGTTYFIQEAIQVSVLGSSYNYSNELNSFSANYGEIYRSINQDEETCYEYTSQDFAVESYENVHVNGIDVSSLPSITTGYTFIRGPNVYASEVAGTTYFVQDAIPVPVNYEDVHVNDIDVSSLPSITTGYTFIRGPNVYAYEVAGSTYFVQDAISVPVNIPGSIQPSYSDDVTHPSSPISSDVLDVENLALNNVVCYSESNENVEISNGQTSSVKCKEDCHSERNKISKRKVKTIKAKTEKSVDYKSSVKTEEFCNFEAVMKLDGNESYVECHEFRYLEVNEKLISNSEPLQPSYSEGVSHPSSPISSDVLDVANIASSISVICYTESEEKVDIANGQTYSAKCKEDCHTVKNKRSKRKVKKRKAKESKLEENENAVKTNQSWNSESIKKVQLKEENKMAVKSNELCNLEGKVKNENSLKDVFCVNSSEDLTLETNKKKLKLRKRKTKIEETIEIKSFAISNGVPNTDFNEKDQTSDKSKISLNSHEHCNLEASKTVKRKSNVKIPIEHECSVKGNAASIQNKNFAISNEVCEMNINKKIQISEECKMSIISQEHSNLEANKTSKKKRKRRKRKGNKILEHQCSVKNEASSAELKENLSKSDIHNICAKSDEVCASTINDECSTVEKNDSNKTFDSSREIKIVSTYVSECGITQNVEEEGETNICTRPSPVQILNSNGNDLFEMSDQKLRRVNEKDNIEYVDEYLVSTSKMDGGSNRQSNVQFQECNSPSDVHVTRTDLSYTDSPSSSPTSKAPKKKRFQRIRKWFNGLFSCVRKNKD